MTFLDSALAAPDLPCPFPIVTPYEVKADLNKLSTDSFSSEILILDAAAPLYRAQKQRIFATPELNALQGSAPSEPLLLTHVLQQLKLPPQPASNATEAWNHIALDVQEDLVVMRLEGERFFPEFMQVCFPTGWDPAQKYAADLRKIHEPVAMGERLQKSSHSLANAMVHKGPFVRYVWTLAASNQLSQHPIEKIHPSLGGSLEASARGQVQQPIYLRVERQVTVPLAAWSRSLFLIRVFVAPVDQVANTPERRAALLASLKSMPPEVIAYKGIEPLLQQYLSTHS